LRILAIDTSSQAASAAIVDDGVVAGEFFVNAKLTHSQTIMPMVDSLINCTRLSLDSIDAFAVSTGPGSFTGLRIGISAAKGLAHALNKPVYAVSTLEGLAYNLSMANGIVCPVMDARCNQVYTAFFECKNSKIKRLSEDAAMSIDELGKKINEYEKTVIFVGDGANLCYNVLSDKCNVALCSPLNMHQRAASVAAAAASGNLQLLSPSELAPSYLRLPQAQRELLAKQNGGN